MTELNDILKGMLEMQAKTNETLEKLSEKIDNISSNQPIEPEIVEGVMKTEDEMKEALSKNSPKIIERKMFKLLTYKKAPLLPEDAYNNGGFTDGGTIYNDTGRWFDSEKEAKEFCINEKIENYKLMPVTVPVPEGQEYKVRRPNLYI